MQRRDPPTETEWPLPAARAPVPPVRAGARRRAVLAVVISASVLLLASCAPSVPPTSVPDPLQLSGSTLTLQVQTSGSLLGTLDATHTSPNIDSGYLVFDPTAATLTFPVTAATLTAGGASPSTITLDGVYANVTLYDDPSSPLSFRMVGSPGTWALAHVAPNEYRPTATVDLTVTLTDPNALASFVSVLTTGAVNTTEIALHASGSVPNLNSGDTLQLALGHDSVVFSY